MRIKQSNYEIKKYFYKSHKYYSSISKIEKIIIQINKSPLIEFVLIILQIKKVMEFNNYLEIYFNYG